MTNFYHTPVLVKEILNFISPDAKALLDVTLGGAGHSALLLAQNPGLRLTGSDRDQDALDAAKKKLRDYQGGFSLRKGAFASVAQQLLDEKAGFDFILADLGVSTHQIEKTERGFSFMNKGPLDMRMCRDDSQSAFEVINGLSEKELARIIKIYGEEPFAYRIARQIIKERKKTPLLFTTDLTKVILAAIPKKFQGGRIHPATKTFQAVRIYVNNELSELEKFLSCCPPLLNKSGRIAVISFHSLEDRIVKNSFRLWEKPCQCPPKIPKCICGLSPKVKRLHSKVIRPDSLEIDNNPKARSAKLRVAEKL